jgi:hypothetical protein
MYKLLDQILNERLKKEIYPKNKELLNPCQTGFKEGLGCEVNILRIVENLQARQHDGEVKNTWVFFLDLKSAFDTVDHRILFEKMKNLNIDGKLINSIEWLYR